MNSETLIGYRKLLVVLIGMFFSWAISKGMPQSLADSLQGMVIELLPTVLSFGYMFFNMKSKELSSASQTNQKTTTAAVAAAETASPPKFSTTQAENQQSQPSETPAQTALKPPVVDTMPMFETVDDCLVADQKAKIATWMGRAVSNPPVVPIIPKEEASLYLDIKQRDEKRYLEAENDIALQAIKVFPGSELDECLKLRKNCDAVIRNRVNYWRNLAMDNWINYGIALWKYREA